MFNITKLCSESQSFMTQVMSNGRSRSKVAALAIARMISSSFTIPTSPVNSPEQEYRVVCQTLATKIVSSINEIIPVDAEEILSLCRSFYMYRYQAVHPTNYVYSFREGFFVEDFFGISKAFGDNIVSVIQRDGKDLAFYANGFKRILQDFKDAEAATAQQLSNNPVNEITS